MFVIPDINSFLWNKTPIQSREQFIPLINTVLPPLRQQGHFAWQGPAFEKIVGTFSSQATSSLEDNYHGESFLVTLRWICLYIVNILK